VLVGGEGDAVPVRAGDPGVVGGEGDAVPVGAGGPGVVAATDTWGSVNAGTVTGWAPGAGRGGLVAPGAWCAHPPRSALRAATTSQ
jgi:hypothetical protein